MRAAVAVIAVACLAALPEVWARRWERHLPPYLIWHDLLTEMKWRQIRGLRRRSKVDVAIIGSSQALMALNPSELLPSPGRCYNAALYRGVPTVTGPWLMDVVLPLMRPRLVVWGLSILDLNDNGPFHRGITQRFDACLARQAGAAGRLKRRIYSGSAAARRHDLFFRPRRQLATLRQAPLPEWDVSRLLGPWGQGMEYLHFMDYRLTDTKARFIRDQVVTDFSFGGDQVQAIRAGAAAVAEMGAALLILEMPATAEFHDMYPRAGRDVEDARRLLSDLAVECGAFFVAADVDLAHNLFADCIHLNGRGMKEWTALSRPVVLTCLKAT